MHWKNFLAISVIARNEALDLEIEFFLTERKLSIVAMVEKIQLVVMEENEWQPGVLFITFNVTTEDLLSQSTLQI